MPDNRRDIIEYGAYLSWTLTVICNFEFTYQAVVGVEEAVMGLENLLSAACKQVAIPHLRYHNEILIEAKI